MPEQLKKSNRRMSRAILFGIDYTQSDQPLRGCSNDVENMSQYLTTKYDTVDVYTEQTTPSKVTGSGILNTLWELVVQSHHQGPQGLQNVWIHFSGHGVGIKDASGDESDGQDEAICPLDYVKNGVISDDILKKMLRYFNRNTQVVCVFDCCHSGTIGDLRHRMSEFGQCTIENTTSECWSNVFILSGCKDTQTSADAFGVSTVSEFTGAMTSCLLDCLKYREQLHSGDVTAYRLAKDVRRLLRYRGFTQVPILTSSRPITKQTVLPISKPNS